MDLEERPAGAATANGDLTAVVYNEMGRPTLFDFDDSTLVWTAYDILTETGMDLQFIGDLVSWNDPKDGLNYAAGMTNEGLYLISPNGNSWDAVNLTDQAAGAEIPVQGLTTFTDLNDTVSIAGLTRRGDLVLYQQATSDPGGPWEFINLSEDHLAPQGMTTPDFDGTLISYVTSWNALNIAGLDANGDVHTVWIADTFSQWRTDNLSDISGAPRYVGGLSTYLPASWAAINIGGITQDGDLVVTWWVESFGGDWVNTNFSEVFGGPALQPDTISSYVTPWDGFNIAGVDDEQNLQIFWWAPGLTDWTATNITGDAEFSTGFATAVRGIATPEGGVSIFGADGDGNLIRNHWRPGGEWAEQDITIASQPSRPPVIATFEADTDTVLVSEPTQVRLTAHVPFATPDTDVSVYEFSQSGGRGDFLFDLSDNADLIAGDAVAGDGVYTHTFAVSSNTTGTLSFQAVPDNGSEARTLEIEVIDAPTQQRIVDLTDFSEEISDEIRGMLTADDPFDVLESAEGMLRAHPELVDPDSIESTTTGLFWRSTEGIYNSIPVIDPTQDNADNALRSGWLSPASTPAAPVVATAPEPAVKMDMPGDPEECGEAIVLAPYYWQFQPGGGDESDEISTALMNDGFDVTYKRNASSSAQNISLDDYRNLDQYDAIAITTHGVQHSTKGVSIDSGVRWTVANLVSNAADLITGRLWIGSGNYMITPSFITANTGTMDDSIVYIGACESTKDASLANAFLGKGAAAYVGYTQIVGSAFANVRGQRVFNTLLNDQTIGSTPGIDVDIEPSTHAALFDLRGSSSAKLEPECEFENVEIYIDYSWPQNVRDLDTSTTFLGSSVGWSCGNSSSYMNWSGDDTSAGGTETVIIDVYGAFQDGQWTNSTTINLAAGWYSPAGGSGPALLSVQMRNSETGEVLEQIPQQAINVGEQSSCATFGVGSITISVSGDPGSEAFSFSFSA